MSATAEEVTVDLAAADAAAAEKAKKSGKQAENAAKEPEVVVDPEVTAAKTAADVTKPEEGIEKLKKDLAAEREARAAAEARAREASQAEAEARGRVQTTELDLVKNAITTVTQANDALEAKYTEALAAQEWATAAKINREIANNSAKLAQLEAGKVQLEKAPKPVARAPVDPVELYCSTLSPKSAAWVRAHPEFARDARGQQRLLHAHHAALADGAELETPEYFKAVEETLKISPASARAANGAATHEDDPHAETAAASTGGRQAAPAAAPVSRSGNGANGSRPNVVRLTADEVEIAQNMGMTPEEYARNKIALKKEGKLS